MSLVECGSFLPFQKKKMLDRGDIFLRKYLSITLLLAARGAESLKVWEYRPRFSCDQSQPQSQNPHNRSTKHRRQSSARKPTLLQCHTASPSCPSDFDRFPAIICPPKKFSSRSSTGGVRKIIYSFWRVILKKRANMP